MYSLLLMGKWMFILLRKTNIYYWGLILFILISSTGCESVVAGRALPEGAEIAYIAWNNNNTELFTMPPSGGLNLTATHNNETFPVWSPDGRHLAFISTQNGNQQLGLMQADGSNKRILAETTRAKDVPPAWAFDSQMIAFVCILDQRTTICLASVTGNWMQIMPGNWTSLGSIHWAPADPTILFHAMNGTSRDIYTYTTYTNSIRNLTDQKSQDYAPAWSPDGRKIAFVSNRNDQTGIYTMNIDGTNPTLLVATNIQDRVYWSPNGQQIAFSQSLGENRLCVLTIKQNTLSCTNKDGSHPAWSPDGQFLVYESRRNNRSYLYLTDKECSYAQRLTKNRSGSFSPVWRP